MDRIPELKDVGVTPSKHQTSLEESVLNEKATKKRAAKSLMNNAGILIGVFIVFAVIIITTTDIHLASLEELSKLGLNFFLLLFCTYSMYIACSDSGMRAGYGSETYKAVSEKYEALKRTLIENDLQSGLCAFCRHYVEEELHSTRMAILAPVGFTYSEYVEKWMNAEATAITESKELSTAQKKALLRANKIKPITLTTDMIVHQGRGGSGRAPLGTNPRTKKTLRFGTKFLTLLLVSTGVVMIVVDVVSNPSWSVFSTIVLKAMTVIINGFSGYKFGFENIVVDTAEFISDQTDLLEQAIKYIEKNNF